MLENQGTFGRLPPELRGLYFEPPEVREVLLQLFGLDPEVFSRAMGVGWLEWANHSEFDAPSFPGTLLWGYTLRAERRELAEIGWQTSDQNNFATSVSPDGRMAIAVETGDRFTGFVGAKRPPRTNSRKGTNTMQMIADNRHILQGDLFEPSKPELRLATRTGPAESPLLWIHLIHQTSGDIVSEISLPVSATPRNRIIAWRCRIILGRWRGGGHPDNLRSTSPEPAPDAILRIVRR